MIPCGCLFDALRMRMHEHYTSMHTRTTFPPIQCACVPFVQFCTRKIRLIYIYFFRLCIYTFGGIRDKNHVHGDLYASHFLATEQK